MLHMLHTLYINELRVAPGATQPVLLLYLVEFLNQLIQRAIAPRSY